MSNVIIPIATYNEPTLTFYNVQGIKENSNEIIKVFFEGKKHIPNSLYLANDCWRSLRKAKREKTYVSDEIRHAVMKICLGHDYTLWEKISQYIKSKTSDINQERFISIEAVSINKIPYYGCNISIQGSKVIVRRALLLLLQDKYPQAWATKKLGELFSQIEKGSCNSWKEYVNKKSKELISLNSTSYIHNLNSEYEERKNTYLQKLSIKSKEAQP